MPLSGAGQDGSRPLVKVQVPKTVDVGDFVRARLARRERLAIGLLAMSSFAGSQKPLLFHKAADGHVTGQWAQARVLAGQGEHVVVVKWKVHRGWSRCCLAIASASAGPTLGCVPACDGTLRARALIGSSTPRAVYHHRSMVLNENRTDSPVVGFRHGRAANSAIRVLSSPSSAGAARSGPRI